MYRGVPWRPSHSRNTAPIGWHARNCGDCSVLRPEPNLIGFLKSHGINEGTTLDELERDRQDLDRLGLQSCGWSRIPGRCMTSS
jgi:hypothetical protein